MWNGHPDVETLRSPEEPPPGLPDWVPGRWYDVWDFTLMDGVTEARIDSRTRIDDALASYEIFRAKREEGTIRDWRGSRMSERQSVRTRSRITWRSCSCSDWRMAGPPPVGSPPVLHRNAGQPRESR